MIIIRSLAFFMCLSFLLWGCKNSDKNHITPGSLSKEDSLYTLVDSAGVPSYLFHFQPSDENTYSYTVETDASIKQELAGKEMETSSNNKVSFHYKSVKLGGDSSRLLVTYDDFKLKGKFGNNEVDIDASQTEEGSPEEIFKALKGASFTMDVSPGGAITRVSGIKALKDSMAKLWRGRPQDVNLLQAQVDKIVSEQSLKQMLGPDYSSFPVKPVKIGDSWKVNGFTVQSDFNVPVVTTYTLKEVEDGVATITMESDIKVENQEMKLQGYSVQSDLSGRQEGQIKLNLVNGILESSEQAVIIDGKMNMLGTDIPVSIRYKSEVKKGKRL